MEKLSPPSRIPEKPRFTGFDIDALELPGYRRDLPHVRLEGATYFVTFRLSDSIPESVARQWQATRDAWLRAHGISPLWEQHDAGRWKVAYLAIPLSARREFERDGHQRFFVELDQCHGSCLLTKCHSTVASALELFHGSRVWTGDYVVMPNHVHVVVQPFPGVKLEDWLYSVKRFTSTQILKDPSVATLEMVESRNVWQTESFDRVVRDRDELARTRRYICNNPARLKPGTFALRQMACVDEFAGKP